MGKLRSIKNATIAAANAGKALLRGDDLNVEPETLAYRNGVCDACTYRSEGTCIECTCVLAVKNRMATERCPRGYWPNVTAVRQKHAFGADILQEEMALLEILLPQEGALLPAAFEQLHAAVSIADCTSCARKQWYKKLEAAMANDRQYIDIHDLRSIFYPATHLRADRILINLLPSNLQ